MQGTCIKTKHTSLFVFGKWGKNLSHKKRQYNYSSKSFTRRAKPIRIASVWMIVKADSHIACRAHAVPLPCREAKGLECVFPI
jgi:hypothetical protein